MPRVIHASRPALRSLLGVAIAAAAIGGTSAAPAQALSLGFNDLQVQRYAGWYGGTSNPAALNAGMANMREAGAQVHRFMLVWNQVAPGATPPATPAEAADPNWSGYRWDIVDRELKAIVANGMTPMPWIARAPSWAEGADRPKVSAEVPVGVWKPSAPALQQFAVALATRYSGTYPDPSAPGTTLPRISTFQAWNEPNLYTEIMPQWTKSGSKFKVSSVGQYRTLLNAFYKGIKSVQPTATVLGAGTAPFGGLYDGEPRIPPARFYRELLCETKTKGKIVVRKGCPKVSLDGWAHHTYPIGPPTRKARNADDVVVPDMAKLTALMNAAAKAKLIKPAAAKNLWMTEMSWDSFPDPNGLSLADHALYMQGAFYVLWKAGVKNILWWNSRDDVKGSDWNNTLQSGIFMRSGTPDDPTTDVRKPSWTAFHFPFAAYRSKGVAALWVKAPGSGAVTVEAKNASGAWSKVTTLSSKGGGVFTGRLRTGPGTNLRAVQGGEISLTWKTF